MSRRTFRALAFVIVAGALALRTVDLGRRPMHHDEANQALKFGDLLERGEYHYDRNDHHGPSLYYLTLPVALAAGRHTLVSLDESVLRFVPALFGAGTVLLLLLFSGLGRTGSLFAGLFAAISPAASYYARFYIQETIFVFFVVAFLMAVRAYGTRPSTGPAVAAGLFAGMMYATKETSAIIVAGVAGALLLSRLTRPKGAGEGPPAGRRLLRDMVLAGLSALALSGLLFSSFFGNPRGVLDSVLAFGTYFSRGTGAGFHQHPWTYYLTTLAFSKPGASAPIWTEGLILLLALTGGVAGFLKRRDREGNSSAVRFIFFYTVLTFLAFSVIAYKTPWNLLPFYAGVLWLAGEGAGFLLSAPRAGALRAGAAIVILAGVVHLGIQSYRANFVFDSDPRNPYVYAQTGRDYLRLVRRVDELSALRPEGRRILIQVFAGPYETWPLPWSLRSYTNVGYWTGSGAAGAVPGVAPLLIASAEESSKLGPSLGDAYHVEYYGLRPEVLLALHVRNDLWRKYLDGRGADD